MGNPLGSAASLVEELAINDGLLSSILTNMRDTKIILIYTTH